MYLIYYQYLFLGVSLRLYILQVESSITSCSKFKVLHDYFIFDNLCTLPQIHISVVFLYNHPCTKQIHAWFNPLIPNFIVTAVFIATILCCWFLAFSWFPSLCKETSLQQSSGNMLVNAKVVPHAPTSRAGCSNDALPTNIVRLLSLSLDT